MRGPKISHTIGLCFSYFDLTLFGGIRKIGHGSTSRWAILPKVMKHLYFMLLIDFLFLDFLNK
jgi:hypothetical protein